MMGLACEMFWSSSIVADVVDSLCGAGYNTDEETIDICAVFSVC